ncbi:unnamed protein product [Moneuplotes crassus]|uniref:Uncharacterized protein n=1 Tax=Euplotes crassus TaxID=5936 RepID=A0AAD1XVW9_EUPCR|nr:unnamed protein product [Moneuplotes crassus]
MKGSLRLKKSHRAISQEELSAKETCSDLRSQKKGEKVQVYDYYTQRDSNNLTDSLRLSKISMLTKKIKESIPSGESSPRIPLCSSESCDSTDLALAEYAKTKAILEQKLEIQNAEISELKARSQKEKECNEAMLEALRSESKPKTYKSLTAIKKIHEQQVETMQNNFVKSSQKTKIALTELREKNAQQELEIRDVKNHFEKLQLKYEYKLKEEEYVRREADVKYKELEIAKNDVILSMKQELENTSKNAENERNLLKKKHDQEIEELKEKYEKALAEIRMMYERERDKQDAKLDYYESELVSQKEATQSHIHSDIGGSNADDSMMSHFSVKFSELNEKCLEIRNQANNEIFSLRQQVEEAGQKIKKLEKLLIRSKNEISQVNLEKQRELKTMETKIADLQKKRQMEDKKAQLILKKKISALKCNLAKMEASRDRMEERYNKSQLELETEKLQKRKKNKKEKQESSRANEATSKVTRNIEFLQNKIKVLEQEKLELEQKLLKQKVYKKASRVKDRKKSMKNEADMEIFQFNKSPMIKQPTLSHSQSNDLLFSRTRLSERLQRSKKGTRELSVNSKQSIPQLNLSGITHGSPDSSHKLLFSNRSHKKNFNGTNTSTNVSQCNSVAGMKSKKSHGHGKKDGTRYCAACKFKEWKKKQLNYDLEMLIRNRDMIRDVHCLGCDRQLEVKTFLEHVRNCRLTYNIPPMVPRDEVITRVCPESKKYNRSKNKMSRSRSKRTDRSITSTTKKSREVSLLDSKDYNLLAASNKNSKSLFGKMSIQTSPKSSKDFISDKSKIQKLRLSSKDSSGRRNQDLAGSYTKFNENDTSFQKKVKKIKNMRYNHQKDEDSDELDIPNENENIIDLSSVNLNQDQDESYSLENYQIVPKSIQVMGSIDKKFKRIPKTERNSMLQQSVKDKNWNINHALSPSRKLNSPLVKRLYMTNFNNEAETTEFKSEAMLEL